MQNKHVSSANSESGQDKKKKREELWNCVSDQHACFFIQFYVINCAVILIKNNPVWARLRYFLGSKTEILLTGVTENRPQWLNCYNSTYTTNPHIDPFLLFSVCVMQVVYFTAVFPYFILLVLLINNVQLPGAKNGILYFVTPVWSKLFEVKVRLC